MVKSKKMLSAILAATIVSSISTGCTQTKAPSSTDKSSTAVKHPEYLNPTGFPIVKQPITLKIMVNNSAVQPDFSNVASMKEYEKMTGIKIDWINIPAGATNEKVNMAFASNDLPDAFLKCGSAITNVNQFRFGTDGMILDLGKDGLLEKYAPNFMKFYNKYDDVKGALKFPNGAIYSFPQAVEAVPSKVAGKLFFNKTWLKTINMQMPTTTEEFYNVLKAFKDKDPNGNGKADEIPFSSANFNYIMYTLQGAFGLGNRGVHDTNVDMDEKTGKPRLIAAAPEYKELMIYINKLYSEGLLDKEIFTMKSAQYTAKQSENLVGAFNYTNLATIPDDIGANFDGIPVALKGPAGHQIWFPMRSHLHSTGAFVITTANKYPEATVRWVDYFYSDEGNLLYNYGKEGESHVKNPDGTYKFVQSVYDSIKGNVTFDAAVAPHVAVGGSNPLIVKAPYFYGREMDPIPAKAAENMMPYAPKEIWPIFTFTPDENDKLSVIQTDITNYVNKMRAEFVTGKTPISEWDNYVKQIKNMGVDEMLEIYDVARKRSNAK